MTARPGRPAPCPAGVCNVTACEHGGTAGSRAAGIRARHGAGGRGDLAAGPAPDTAGGSGIPGRAGRRAAAAVDGDRLPRPLRLPRQCPARRAAEPAGSAVLLGGDPVDHRLRRHRPGHQRRAADQHAGPDADPRGLPDPADRDHPGSAGRADQDGLAGQSMEVEDGRSHRAGRLRHQGPQRNDHAARGGRAGHLDRGRGLRAAGDHAGQRGRAGRRDRRRDAP
jgi:hypothetical protein